ncbi:hypothetical protein [Arthrobacter sp. NPDC057009]|uniref:hypothetical protein n=1 Tax=Arthrobacter sp. NPDC057009 TaxID=3345996 RepID=UPI0036430EB3
MDSEFLSQHDRVGFAVSAALMLALTLAAAMISVPRFGPVSGLTGENKEASGGRETAPGGAVPRSLVLSDRPAQKGNPGASVCGLPAGNETALGARPAGNWQLVGSMAVPAASRTSGPGTVDATGFRTCFARSPAGALFAAANFWATGLNGDADRAYRELTARGPGRDAVLTGIALGRPLAPPGRKIKLQFKGFILRAYEARAATFDLAVQRDDGSMGSLPTKLVWEDGDWKVVLPGSGNPGVSQIANLREYIPWGGV